MDSFTIWVSRRFWLWPKKYRCKGVTWGLREERPRPDNPAVMEITIINPDILFLILADERRVYIDVRGRTITYGRDLFELECRGMSEKAGQAVPLKGVA